VYTLDTFFLFGEWHEADITMIFERLTAEFRTNNLIVEISIVEKLSMATYTHIPDMYPAGQVFIEL